VVPARRFVIDIGIVPLLRNEIEGNGVRELALRVPATIDVQFGANREHGMSTSALGRIVGGLDSLPLMSLQVEGVEIVECNALVVETTMTSEDVDLIV
jgi:hypothetical protein